MLSKCLLLNLELAVFQSQKAVQEPDRGDVHKAVGALEEHPALLATMG